jgi:hypothetical protein
VQVITASKLRAVLGRLPGPRVVMSGNFGTPWRALSILDTAVVEYHLFTAGAPVVRGDSLARPARGGRSARADGGHLYDDLRGARSHMLCMRWNLRISSLPANRATATTTATASAAHVVRFIAEPLSVPGANPIAPVTSHGDRSRPDALGAKVRGARALGPPPELPGPAARTCRTTSTSSRAVTTRVRTVADAAEISASAVAAALRASSIATRGSRARPRPRP